MNQDPNINDVILKIILDTIKAKGLTEKSVLTESAVSTSFLTDWKKGRIVSPAFDKVYRILMTLQINFDSLFNEDGELSNHKPTSEPTLVDEKILLDTYRELNQEGKSLLQTKLREIWKIYRI